MSCYVRVGTFNAYNLVLPDVPYYNDQQYTPQEYQQKKQWMTEQLHRLQADILGFQEVFHEQALREVLAESQLYTSAKVLTANPMGDKPTVALVSRLPVLWHQIIVTFPEQATFKMDEATIPCHQFAHPILQAEITLPNSIVCTVFAVHLKSKRPMIPEGNDRHDPIEIAKGQARSLIQRAAETIALRVILVDLMRNTNKPVIVIGDINDGDRAVTSRILSGEPPNPEWDHAIKQKHWDMLLYTAKDIHARQTRCDSYYTLVHDSYYESLDHILFSQEFMAQNPSNIGRVNYVSVLNDHLIDKNLTGRSVEPWKSDHGQVVAQIELKNHF